MNADTRHGGLRPKRCLPAKFHFESPPLTYLRRYRPRFARRIVLSPQVAETIVSAPKRANSRFFTDCYPISAVFAPKLNQTPPRIRAALARSSDHGTHN